MALTIAMPIKVDESFHNAERAGLTCMPHYVADTSTHQPHQRKFETVSPPRSLKQKCSTLKSCLRKHRLEARVLAKSRRSKQLSMRRKRRVRFHPSVKKHDGISTANAHLERMIYDFWKKQNLDLLAELSRDSKHTDLNNLIIKLRDLLHRMRQSGDKHTVLLPRGGGTAAKMSKLHIPHVNHLLQRAIQVRDECMRRNETNWTLLFTRKTSDALGLVLHDVPDLDADLDANPDDAKIDDADPGAGPDAAQIDANIGGKIDVKIDADLHADVDAAADTALHAVTES